MLSYWQVLVTIRCLTKGIFYSECGDLHGISKSSVCIAMDRVLTSLCHRLQNISFPTSEEEIRRTKTEFFSKARFPNVLGAVDGTLKKIQAPSENEPSYVCRKGFHALNVQAVSDASLRYYFKEQLRSIVNIIHIVVLWRLILLI